MKVPANPETMTCAWLTEALQSSGTIGDAEVESFDIRRIGVEAGFTSNLVRIRLAYSDPPAEAPASVVGKFVPFDPKAQEFAQNSSRTEILFFSELTLRAGRQADHAVDELLNG